MSFVSQMFERVQKWRKFRPPKTFEERLSWLFQPYLGTLEDIILWKNPAATVSVIGLVNIFFLLIWHLEIRLLGVIFALALACVAAEGTSAWLVHRAGRNTASRQGATWGSAGDGATLHVAAQRAQQWLSRRMADLLALREQNPPQFCLLVCLSLLASAFLGSKISGVVLLYLSAMALLLVPGLAPKALSAIKGLHPQTDSDGEVEGFMPELSSQMIDELQKAGDVPSLQSDSVVPEEWIPKNDSTVDEEDYQKTSSNLLNPRNISDSSSNSSDDEFLPRIMPRKDRLQLQTSPIPTAPPGDVLLAGWSSGALGALGTLGGALGALLPGSPGQIAARKYTRVDSDDSDEFELIDKDNL